MRQLTTRNFSLYRLILLTACLGLTSLYCSAFGQEIHVPDFPSMSDDELLKTLESRDQETAHGAVVEIMRRGEPILPVLLRLKGNKKFFYGYGLGHHNSAMLIPLPTGNRKSDEGRVITVEVAGLYLISAIYHESLEFSHAPYLTDDTPVKMQRYNTSARVTKAWQSVSNWYERVKLQGLERLRSQQDSPLKGSGLRFYASSE
jgi:hypothetical protein